MGSTGMDYLVDQIPFIDSLSQESRQTVTEWAVSTLVAADWACGLKDWREQIRDHLSFFIGEIVFFILAAITFVHAWRKGGRYMYMWIGIILHSLNVELIAYLVPDVDNFWHAQGLVTLFGRRMPLYILFGIYSVFDYTAAVAARRMHLPWYSFSSPTWRVW